MKATQQDKVNKNPASGESFNKAYLNYPYGRLIETSQEQLGQTLKQKVDPGELQINDVFAIAKQSFE